MTVSVDTPTSPNISGDMVKTSPRSHARFLMMENYTDVYSPFTGRGFHPLVKDLPWKGLLNQLWLKDEHGNITCALPSMSSLLADDTGMSRS